MMMPVEPAFAEVLESASARWDGARAGCVTSNLTGEFHDGDEAELRVRLVRQISATVRWRDNMVALTTQPTRIVEIGPGRPLRQFFKAIGVAADSITDVRSAERVLATRSAA
jgi:[acyl-carrier-protein] S-malonyltransferase/trans-AT polyketide synthase/acyltransferase/oxidoreductase domain-containing protein